VENLVLSQVDAFTGTGNASANSLEGSAPDNILIGLGGADTLDGQGGADTLRGGAAADRLIGGTGNDRFDFDATSESPSGAGRDVITLFDGVGAGAGDLIDVSTIDARTNVIGNQAFSFIGTAGFSASGQVRAVDAGADVVLQFNTDANLGTVEMEILVLGVASPSSFTSADFVL
jgi:Ca2+-binding RTX toxin-like protein